MNTDTRSLADLEARLAKLERQNRRLKRLGLLFLLIAGSGFLLAQAPRKPLSAAPVPATPAASYDTLVVHRLELRDKAGTLGGLWTADLIGPRLELYDTAGEMRVWLSVTPGGPVLDLSDTARKTRARLSVTADGPDLRLYDAAEKRRAGLSVGDAGPALGLYDTAGQARAALAAPADGPTLALYDAAGRPRAGLSEGSLDMWGQNGKVWASLDAGDSGPILQLRDAQQFRAVVGVTELETITTGESHKTGAAAVTLFGKDGKVIWRAP